MITINLDKCLFDVKTSARQLAKESGLRPNTLSELRQEKAKRADFETLDTILNTLNRIAIRKGLEKRFAISDLITYEMGDIQLDIDIEYDEEDPAKEQQ